MAIPDSAKRAAAEAAQGIKVASKADVLPATNVPDSTLAQRPETPGRHGVKVEPNPPSQKPEPTPEPG